MFPRHETALIHYTGRAMINLGLDFTPRDSVDSYSPEGYATCPARLHQLHALQVSQWIKWLFILCLPWEPTPSDFKWKPFRYYQFETSTSLKRTLCHTFSLSTTTQSTFLKYFKCSQIFWVWQYMGSGPILIWTRNNEPLLQCRCTRHLKVIWAQERTGCTREPCTYLGLKSEHFSLYDRVI